MTPELKEIVTEFLKELTALTNKYGLCIEAWGHYPPFLGKVGEDIWMNDVAFEFEWNDAEKCYEFQVVNIIDL